MMCCTQPKLALPTGGLPNCQRLSSRRRSPPVGDVEWWVGEDEIGFQIRMTVVVKSIAVGDLAVDATQREIHFCEAPGRVIAF